MTCKFSKPLLRSVLGIQKASPSNNCCGGVPIKEVVAGRGVIFNKQNKLLLTSEDGEVWHIPGGWRGFLESAVSACEREVLEETGLTVKCQRAIYVDEMILDNTQKYGNIAHRLDIYFLCTAVTYKIDANWQDSDSCLIKHRKFFSEVELKKLNFLGPDWFKKLPFSDIKKMPKCYSWKCNEQYKNGTQ